MKLEGKSELFRMLGSALRPSRSASSSIDYPMRCGHDPQDDTDGIPFMCVECGYEFFIDPRDYRGQFDHPPSEPVCPECQEKLDE